MIHETSPPQRKIAIFHHDQNIHNLLTGHFQDENFFPIDIPLLSHRYNGRIHIEKFFIQEKPPVAIVGIHPTDQETFDFLERLKTKDTIHTEFMYTTTIPNKLLEGRILKNSKMYQEPFDLDEVHNYVMERFERREGTMNRERESL